VIDEATRSRRQRKALDALEKDNFQDAEPGQEMSRKRKLKPESKLRHRKNYANLLEEEVKEDGPFRAAYSAYNSFVSLLISGCSLPVGVLAISQ